LTRICYFDAFSGLSGDMLVGSLADAGADPETITEALNSIQMGATFSFERVKRRELGAMKFRVAVEETAKHRHLPGILKMIDRAEMVPRAKDRAAAVFQRLAEAEAGVHETPIEKVHFHEVGAADSIADIVGACLGLELLGVENIFCSPINVGSGTVNTEHGVLPVPAPATAALLRDRPIYARGPALELTTPTGAAVITTLAAGFGAMPAMNVASIGYGAGDKDFKEHANVLRVMVGTLSGATEATTVSVLEANLDDSTPQVVAFAVEKLLDAGALDATLTSIQMKKGRPGVLLRVIAAPERREDLARLIFAETSTLGLRIYMAERRVQAREWVVVETAHGKIRVKVGGDGSFAPEYEDCRAIAFSSGVPLKQVIAAASHAYLSQSQSK
jgi:pyridinium-3,5-bisthiocarboxylic acid mononucleotide nickel chelatase